MMRGVDTGSSPRPWRSSLSASLRKPAVGFSVGVLVVLVVAAGAADIIAPFDPAVQSLTARNLPPMRSADGDLHILGTDHLGRDVLTRLIYGARISLLVGLGTAFISGVIGIFMGLLAGYYGGWLDSILMRTVDVALALPTLMLALFLLFIIGPSFAAVIFVLAVTRWMVYARVTRALVLSAREMEYVAGARSIGAKNWRIMLVHILPNILSTLAIVTTLEIASIILSEAALSFLGLGVQPPTASWGLMISEGRAYLTVAWWQVVFPGIAILATTASLNRISMALSASDTTDDQNG